MALRNIAYKYEAAEEKNEQEFKLVKNIKSKVKSKVVKKSKAALVASLTCIFVMLLVLNYRNNLIAEKNLKMQRLQISKTEVDALLTNAEVSLSRLTDLTEVEAYAKQQLGMQEPEKSQMIYINVGTDTEITKNNEQGRLTKVISKIKETINSIF